MIDYTKCQGRIRKFWLAIVFASFAGPLYASSLLMLHEDNRPEGWTGRDAFFVYGTNEAAMAACIAAVLPSEYAAAYTDHDICSNVSSGQMNGYTGAPYDWSAGYYGYGLPSVAGQTHRFISWALMTCPVVDGQTGIKETLLTGETICTYDVPPPVCGINTIAMKDQYGDNTACIDTGLPAATCTNVLGSVDGVDICGDDSASCTAEGGTYGFIGGSDFTESICISPTVPNSDGTCPQSYLINQVAPLNEGDAWTLRCVQPPSVPPTICDGRVYDCDGDGNVDDQDGNGIKDNGSRATEEACLDCLEATPFDPVVNVGVDPLATPEEGAGDCDPTARNYAECIGMVPDDIDTDVGVRTNLSSGNSLDELGVSVYQRLELVPVVAMVGNVSGLFTLAGAVCPAPEFSLFGTTFALDYHCTLYELVRSVLSALMIVVFTISGIRHVASA